MEYVRERDKTTSSVLYKANVRLMCSNMEQIITVVGKGVAEIKALCQQYSKDTVGPFLKLDSLMKGLRKNRRNRPSPFREFAHRGGVKASARLRTLQGFFFKRTQRDLCHEHS